MLAEREGTSFQKCLWSLPHSDNGTDYDDDKVMKSFVWNLIECKNKWLFVKNENTPEKRLGEGERASGLHQWRPSGEVRPFCSFKSGGTQWN